MNAGLAHTDLVVRSLETAATRCDDPDARRLCPPVRRHAGRAAAVPQGGETGPGARCWPARSRRFSIICGPRAYGVNLVMSEVVNHAAYDLPPQAFSRFFGFVADAVRDVIGPDWTAETAAAWKAMIEEISAEAAAAS